LKAKEFFKDANKKTVLFVLACALAVGGYYLHDHRSGNSLQYIGGLDLARYCKSYGYEGNNSSQCFSVVNLTEACDWQYQATNLTAKEEHGPESTLCYTPKNESKGGISDMLGYCQTSFHGNAGITAEHTGDTWYCRNKINPRSACDWEYAGSGLKAQEKDGVLGCYKRQ